LTRFSHSIFTAEVVYRAQSAVDFGGVALPKISSKLNHSWSFVAANAPVGMPRASTAATDSTIENLDISFLHRFWLMTLQ
jgi:hypothetical protein